MIRHKDYLLVQVPSMAFGFDVNNYGDSSEFMFMIDMGEIDKEFESDETLITKELPKGKWEVVGLAAEITEGQKKEIVRRNDFREIDDHDMFEWFLKSHNLSENQTVILKLIEA